MDSEAATEDEEVLEVEAGVVIEEADEVEEEGSNRA